MKKVLSFVLVLTMLLSLAIPLTAAGAGGNFRLESTKAEYNTLHEAVAAAKAGDTITLLKDYDAAGEQNKYAIEKPVTVDGGGHTINGASYLWFLAAPAGTAITIRNLNIKSTHGFRVRATGQTVNVENVNAEIRAGLFMNLQIQNKPKPLDKEAFPGQSENSFNTVNFKDSTITHIGNDPVMATYGKANWTIDLKNSKLQKSVDSPFKDKDYHGNYTGLLLFTGKKMVVNLDGTSEISGSRRAGCAKVSTIYVDVYRQNTSGTADVTINLAKGSKLKLNDVNNQKFEYVAFGNADSLNKTKIVDSGCNYYATANVLKNGVTLPNITLAGGKKLLGFQLPGVGLVGNSYKNTAATEAASFTAVGFGNQDFALVNGASIRTAAPYGIRFSTQISADFYNTLKAIDAKVEFGTVIAPTEKVFDGFNVEKMLEKDYVKVARTKWGIENQNGIYEYRLAMYDIPETKAGFETKLSAIAYFNIHFADGKVQTVYTQYSKENNSRSIYDVAKAAFADGVTDSQIINNIISTVEK